VTAPALLADIEARGARVTIRGDRLRVEAPRGVLTPSLRALLLEVKPALLGLLASRAPTTSTDSPRAPSGYAFPWPDLLVGLGVRRVQPFDLCADCRSGTWVAYGARPLCLVCARQRGAATGTD
jgi:hypothetical protein